jgi:hypothetical protein
MAWQWQLPVYFMLFGLMMGLYYNCISEQLLCKALFNRCLRLKVKTADAIESVDIAIAQFLSLIVVCTVMMVLS